MKELLSSQGFILLLIFGSYLFGQWVFKKTKIGILHPLVIAIGIIILFLKVSGISYERFETESQPVSFMLGPSVVALGYILYQQIEYLKGNVVPILTSIFVGSLVGIGSVVLIAKFMGADDVLIMSLEPKSVTTPIAMSIAEQSGGIPALTAIIVVFCGILGGIIGPYILKMLGIKSRIAKGLAMGASAHAVGTAKAMEMGVIEGALSGLAIGLMGVMTALLIPFLHHVFS
ncbi:LrgB family protein [Dysgonomonas sp. 520]|uniref:LrgB family protein n=1 Tax=Dysgonomonas sp. 520 TaxID=2302931 RepID=UPI0013D833D6|nr:LrgB family protein [Dysgonomonas sp. 520]NDW09897.1 LrgB family protein [Dysgonomonas sp. 520]